jgi:TatD DNase family protein
VSYYVDVHTHLTHELFENDLEDVVNRATERGLKYIVVNGLEPKSNDRILEMAKQYPTIKPALGIYPLDAINGLLPADFPYPVPAFDVKAEVKRIAQRAENGEMIAVGECGLDAYYVGQELLPPQEEIFEMLIEIAKTFNLPLIIHTRKAEARAAEILAHHNVQKVNFHCFGGRVALAKQLSEKHGWHFSIPCHAVVNEAFQKMMKVLPFECLLTETDAPYLPPRKGERNEPANVPETVALMAKLRNVSEPEAKQQVAKNFEELFLPK